MVITSEQSLGDCVLPAPMLSGGWGDFSTPGSPAKALQWAPCWLRAQVSPGGGSDGLGHQAGAFRTRSVRSLPCRRQHLLWEVGSGP